MAVKTQMVALGFALVVASLDGASRSASAIAQPASLLKRSQTEFNAAKDEVARLAASQRRLAKEIDQLKRRSGPSAELTRLLQASVEAQAALERADDERRRAAKAYARAVRRRISAIDEEMRSQLAGLRTGALETRREVARLLKALHEERRVLSATLAELTPVPKNARRWASFRITVDPLDGPQELQEKADFLEDARDKLRKKATEIAALVVASKRSRRLQEAANRFRMETGLFDEELRPERVTRGRAPAPLESAPVVEPTTPERSAGAPESPGPSPGGALEVDTSNAPRRAIDQTVDFGQNRPLPRDDRPSPNQGANPPQLKVPTPPPVVKELGRLLELDPSRLDLSTTSDPEALTALLERLRKAEKELARSADEIRRRAKTLR